MKKVSVVVPCYNQGIFLDDAIESIVNQTYSNWECIIVNDGSTDLTHQFATNWLANDSRIIYILQNNKGLSAARNTGIKVANGEFIIALDADDFISQDYIEKLILEFEKNSNLKIAYSKAMKFGTENGYWNLPDYNFKNILDSNMIYCSAMFKKTDWLAVGGYDEKLIYGIEDWEFWIAVLKYGGEVKRIDFIGFYYRIKSNSMITNLLDSKYEASRNYIYIKHARVYGRELGRLKFILKRIRGKKYYIHNKKFIIDLCLATFFGFTIFKSSRVIC